MTFHPIVQHHLPLTQQKATGQGWRWQLGVPFPFLVLFCFGGPSQLGNISLGELGEADGA